MAALPAGAAPEGWAGRPLAEALLDLQRAAGLRVAFTSELVRPELVVAVAPTAEEPRAALDQLLAPHGLAARELADGLLVVVARAPGEATEPVPATAVPGPFLHVRDEIVVRPSRVELLGDGPDASFAWSSEEIASVPHLGGDVFRALSLLPGVAANDVTARPSVRGGRPDEVRVLLDGQELYDAYHLHDYDGALSVVPARSLAAAVLTTGAFPASHGDRMGAVLDLRTVDPPSGRRFAVGVGALELSAAGSGRFAEERGGWLASLRRGSLDLARDAIGDEDPRFWDALGKLEWGGERGSWRLQTLLAGDALALDVPGEEEFETVATDYESGHLWLTHERGVGARWRVESRAAAARIRRDRGAAASEEEGAFVLSDRRDVRVDELEQTWTAPFDRRHVARAGVEHRRYDADFRYAKDLELDLVIEAPFAAPRRTAFAFDDTLRGEHTALWASDLVAVTPRLTAEVGLRHDHYGGAIDDDVWSPRLSLAWRAGERSVLRAAWGRYAQSQRPHELQVEDGETALAPPEVADHWVLGAETALRPNPAGVEALRLELYRRETGAPRPRYENLLEPLNFHPEIEPDRVRIAPEDARAEGVELLVRGRRGERASWWMAYTWARAEDRLGGRWVPRALDQRHTVAAELSLRLPRRFSLDLAWRFHTGWPTTPVELHFREPDDGVGDDGEDGEGGDDGDDGEGDGEPPALVPVAVFGPLRSARLPDYHRLDLRLRRTWERPFGRLTFYVDVQNVYDRENLAGFDVAVDEDEGVLELEEESWPGLFPSLGIIWEL